MKAVVGGNDGANNQPNGQVIHQIGCKRDDKARARTLGAWLIWTIWQKSNPTLADQVTAEPRYAIFRDTGVALTKRGQTKSEAKQFVAFLTSAEGAAIFRKWGWIAPAK